MADKKTFHLPDLGEGLPDATIVEWLVKEGDSVKLDAPLVSMETAKAVVEVPSPFTGKLLKQHGAAGDVINTGAPLAEFELDPKGKQRAENAAGGHHAPAQPAKGAGAPAPDNGDKVIASDEGGEIQKGGADREDEGTVVGAVSSSNEVRTEQAGSVGGAKAVPAVRAMARKLKVDLARVQPTGAGGVVTMQDVKNAAAAGTAQLDAAPAAAPAAALVAPVAVAAPQRSTVSQSGKPMRTTPPSVQANGQPEQLKGVRRNMARVMADARDRVMQTTIVDDADLHAWIGKQDITARTIRAIVAACSAGPHHGHAHLAHHGAHVGEVDVDQARAGDQVGDALHRALQHVVGGLECIQQGHFAAEYGQQLFVRHRDQGIHRLRQILDALQRHLHAPAALERERLGHHRHRQDALLLGKLRHHRRRAGAGATAHAAGDEHHVGAVQHLDDAVAVLERGLPADLGVGAGAETLGHGFAELQRGACAGAFQRLRVCVGADEFHAVDG